MTAATASSGESYRPYWILWILLNMYAEVGKKPNDTTARCNGRNGVTLESSLVRERPPLPSNLFVHCTGATFGEPPCVLSMVDNLILFYVYTGPLYGFPTPLTSDFFMYRADPERRSLKRLPNPEGRVMKEDAFGIFSRGEDHYTIAALIPLRPTSLFSLHLYDSETDIWSWKRLSVQIPQKEFPGYIPRMHLTSTVLTLNKSIGWVDHSRGIVFCDMLSEEHTLSGIPLPLPVIESHVHSRYERGIAFINGCLRLVEVGLKVVSDVPALCDEETGWPSCRAINWTITTWTNKNMGNSFDDWDMDCTLKASEIFLGDDSESELPLIDLQNLFVSDPIIGMNENDSEVIYLTAREKFMHPKSWVLAIDTRDCKVQSLVVRSGPLPQEMRTIDAHYCTCSISN